MIYYLYFMTMQIAKRITQDNIQYLAYKTGKATANRILLFRI
jgi:hypothetical protein